MIERFEINGVHMKADEKLKAYTTKKIGKLDKYLPRYARSSAHIEVKLKESNSKSKKQYTCEVILHLPHDILTTKETTQNMYAAVDIVEAKLRNLIRAYKEKHQSSKFHRRMIAEFRGKFARTT